MKNILSEIRPAILSTFIFATLCCGLYPLAVTSIAQFAFAKQANGSLIHDQEGKIIGSSLLGQSFRGAGYFHSRPSAAGANGYDAANSSGSNLGPTSQKLADQIKERIADYRAINGLTENQAVPADAVTASASGLDPHISVANADGQVARVAKARQMSMDKVREMIAKNTEMPELGLLGEARVNVLKLNLALDELAAESSHSSVSPK